MRRILLALSSLLLAAGAQRAPAQETAREVVRAAQAAVEAGDADRLVARWNARLARGQDPLATLGLATVARLTYRFEDATRLYDRLAARPDTDPLAVWTRIGQGMLLEVQGDRRSIDRYARARELARRAGLRADEGAALLELAFSELGPKGAALTLARLDTVAHLLDPRADELHARRLRYKAVVLVVSAAATALDTTRAAIALARRGRHLREEAAAHRTLGLYFSLRGTSDSVLPHFAAAESLFARSGDLRGVAYTLMFRGDFTWSRGLLGPAKEAIERALPLAEASNYREGVAHVHVGLASVASRVGDYPLALRHADRAIATYDSLGDRYGSKLTHALRAQILLMAGDTEGARRESPWLLDVIRSSPEVTQRIEGQQVLVSAALMTGRLDEAERHLAASARHAREAGMDSWIPRIALAEGRVAILRGETARARSALQRALRTLAADQHVPRYEARVALAEVRVREGDVAGAAAEMDAAVTELDRWRAGLTEQELRMLAFQSLTPDAGDQTPSVARVLNALAMRGFAERAFELAERRRARELTDRLVRRTALFGGASGAAATARPIRTTSTARAAAAALPRDAAVLEYVTAAGGAPTTLFVVTRDGVRAHTLVPEDSVRRDVARLADLLEAGSDPRPLARSLGDRLLAPVLRELPAHVARLVIVPDGALHRVPFDALRPGGRLVIERFAVGIAPSAEAVTTLRDRRARDDGPTRLLAFADPVIDVAPRRERSHDANDGSSYASAFARTGGLPRLPSAAREARLVARYASDAEVFEGRRATAARLLGQDLRDVDVLHLATHALVDEQAITGTALALASDGRTSGFLTPGDLASLRLDARLVVLSACRSAGGALVGGEGILGLTSPLLEAGASAVVATRWRIADRSTVPFIRDFYDALAADEPVADALRSAKLAAIARGDAPREWAAFQVIGDPLVRVPLRGPSRVPRPWLVATAILAVALPIGWLALRRPR